MKKGMGRTGRWSMVALVALALTGVAGCVSRSSAPGANKALGSFAQGGYVLLRWDAGLGVMIWHDLNGESEAHSTGSSSGPIYTERGYARSADGRSLTWEVQTREGKEGEIDIGGARYDLAAGSLFIVTTEGGGTAVRQLVRDLSDVPLDHDGILAFARRDPELSVLLLRPRPSIFQPRASLDVQ